MDKYGKWGQAYWADLAERVGSTFLGALLTVLTVTGSTPVDWSDAGVVWAILGVPTLVSLVKGLLANMAGPDYTPSASAIDVDSYGGRR